MSDADKPSDPSHDRRAFFRQGLSRLMKPAAKYLESKLPGIAASSPSRPLRPPGAMLEPEFLNTCYRCGSCADHCPADSITLLQVDDERLKGTPAIDPTRRACVVCDELACMKVCPSGALKLVDRTQIRMGLAVWDEATCSCDAGAANSIDVAPPDKGSLLKRAATAIRAATVRERMASQSEGQPTSEADATPSSDRETAAQYTPENCTICVDVCPYGGDAIRIEDGRVQVIDPRPTGTGCTGCGVCQEQCPTRPKRAIRVLPYALS